MKRQDFVDFYGTEPPYSFKAWVAELDGKVIGLAGFALGGAVPMAFSDMTEEMAKYPVTIMRESRRVMNELAGVGRPLHCLASKHLPNSEAFLQRLGWTWFRHDENGEVYTWQSPS